MNMHTHYGLVLPGRQGAELANETDAALALRMAANARISLLSGVTTTRSTGESKGADYALRRAIDRGEAIGPRIFTAGETLNVTGGHGWNPSEEGLDSPDAFRRAVRRRAFDGAEWIKIAISGGIADTHGDIAASHMTKEEVAAVTDTAHRHGLKVTAHSGSPGATLEAIEAGLDCVEHGYFLTDEVLRRMVDKGVWLVPTIVVAQPTVMEFFRKIGSPDWYLARVDSVGESHFEDAAERDQAQREDCARHRSVPVRAQRRDDGHDSRGAVLRRGGHDTAPGAALGHRRDGHDARRSSIAPAASSPASWRTSIVTDADPSRDIRALRAIKLVMKGGVVVRNDLAR